MNRFNKIIFVCSNGTRLSPMAMAIMKSKKLEFPLEIVTRGIVVLFPEPLNQKAEAIMIANNVNAEEFLSQQITEEDFTEDTLVLTMEEQQKQKIFDEYENQQNVYMLTEYVGESGDILNPYGGSLQDYGMCYEQLEYLIEKLVKKMNEQSEEDN